MQYILVFAILLSGYTLLDWGVLYMQHKPVSMWYLISGSSTASGAPRLPRPIFPYTGPPATA